MTEREDTIERIERVLKLTHKKSITVTIPKLTAERAVSLLKEQEPMLRKEYERGYKNGRADEAGLRDGTIMQAFNPD